MADGYRRRNLDLSRRGADPLTLAALAKVFLRRGGGWNVRRSLGTALSVALLVALVPSSGAKAETRVFVDGTTTPGPMDIHRVVVANERRLQIRVEVADLRRRFWNDNAAAWIDTNADRRGAEFVIASGLWESDWQIFRARGKRAVGTGPLNCPVDQRLLFRQDVIVWSTGRACLGRYTRVRVAVDAQKGAEKDHSPGPRRFHPCVGRG